MILEIKKLSKNFPNIGFSGEINVLKELDLTLEKGNTTAIVGQSGSGKSTLLSLLSGLDSPSSGSLKIMDENLESMNEANLTKFRSKNIGIIFQQFHLMAHLNAFENVSLPLEMIQAKKIKEKTESALDQVGLKNRFNHFPHQLSGGESQRVAIARAIVINPALLLADEPSGNLDYNTGEQVAELLFNLVKNNKMTMVLVTHNSDLAKRCDHKFTLRNGKLLKEK